jgi:beta-glucosidase/6-phospho-beta-glucosidase/beta-galactosidase
VSVSLLLAALVLSVPAHSAEQQKSEQTSVGEEHRYFGVNYNAPFAFTRRAIVDAGFTVRDAIDMDVAQFKRLGINAFRVHVWDREIANRDGSLRENEHIQDLDYLLARLNEADIRVVLTLIAWWPNGYPANPTDTNSFSDQASREELASNEELWPVMHRYGQKLLTRRNSVTGVSYLDDPNIVAIELFNEPKHSLSEYDQRTRFVDEFVSALREIGYAGAVFYNISEQGPDLDHGTAICSAASATAPSATWSPSTS